MTERKCCGQPCPTRFCGHCGKDVRGAHPLDGLLAHCRDTAKTRRGQEKRYLKMAKTSGGKHFSNRIAKQEAIRATKWEEWASELEKLLRGEQPPKENP